MTTTAHSVVGDVRSAVDALLEDFLTHQEQRAATPQVSLFIEWLRGCLAGGKRLRPALCYSGWRAAGGTGAPADVIHLAASLELFHAFALVHDDVMDDSDTRRGRQTLHRQIATRYPTHPASEQFGRHTAILLGDLILGWSYELVHGAELDPARASRVWLLLNAMRTETLSGQYLDLLSTGVLDDDMEGALTVATYKTAKYTVERPLQLGSILAGAGQEMLDTWTAYGIPVGEAFQLRDDLLGVFADPADTGKSAIDDLRDGKHTVLLALAWKRADADQRSRLRALIGNPDLDETHAAEIRHIFTVTGSRATVEEMIVHRYNAALAALQAAQLPAEDDAVLRELATRATQRGH